MEITLSDGTVIEVLLINIEKGFIDWKRQEGYTGACQTAVELTDYEHALDEITAVLEIEMGLVDPPVVEHLEVSDEL